MHRCRLLLLVAPLAAAAPTGCTQERRPAPDAPCASGESLEGEACVPATCGAPPWADAEVAAWVDASAPEGGDGSLDAPFLEVQEALDEGLTGLVAVAPGDYTADLSWTEAQDGLRLLGRCSSLVTLHGSGDGPTVSVDLGSKRISAELGGLTIDGGSPGLAVDSGALTLTDVVVHATSGAGVTVADPIGSANASLSLRSVDIEEVSAGRGIWGASTWSRGVGLLAGYGARIDGDSLSVAGTAAYGVWTLGADADLDALSVQDAMGLGIAASVGSTVRIGALEVSGVGDDTSRTGFAGMGLFVESSSTMTVEHPRLEGLSWYGAYLYGASGSVEADLGDFTLDDAVGYGIFSYLAELSLSGCQITGLQPQPIDGGTSGAWGIGAWTPEATLDDCALAMDGAQIFATEGSTLRISDSNIDGSAHRDDYFGCLQLADSYAEVTDTTIRDCEGAAILGDSSDLYLRGVTLDASGAVSDGDDGVVAPPIELRGSSLVAEQLTLTDSLEVAMLLEDDSVAWLKDVDIDGVRRADDLAMAIGLLVQEGSRLEADDLSIHDVEGIGSYVMNGGLQCMGCEVSDATFAGIWGAGRASVSLLSSTIQRISHDESTGGGVGIGMDLSTSVVPFGAFPRLYISDSRIEDVERTAIYLEGAGTYLVQDSLLEAGSVPATTIYPYSNAVFVTDGVSRWPQQGGGGGLLLERDELVGGNGGAIFLDASSATLRDLRFTDTTYTVIENRCDGVPEPEGIDDLSDTLRCADQAYDSRVELLSWYLYSLTDQIE